jgi:TRAP-type transport system periplasmic protein
MSAVVRNALLGLGLALALPAGLAEAQSQTFRLGTVDAPASHSGIGADAFAAAVERLSGGDMKVEVFHAGQLGAIPAQIANVFAGTQDMHQLYPEFLSGMVSQARLISLPYLFESLEHLQAFYKSDLWRPALDQLEGQGAIILDPEWTWMIRDPRGFIAVRPIFSPDDLEGLRMRIWEDRSAIETWEGFGSTTTVVPRPEMYLAFTQGIIEGGPETIGIAVDQKNVEVAKYWMRTGEYHQIINIMMTKRRWESLSAEQQAILREAMLEAGQIFVAATTANFEGKKFVARTEHGVSIIEPALGPWHERGAETVARLVADGYVPGDLIEGVRGLR